MTRISTKEMGAAGGRALGALGALTIALLSGCRGEAEAQPAGQVPAAGGAGGAASTSGTGATAAKPATEAPKLAVPASWRPMPEAVHAVEESLAAAKMAGARVAAWGDPARGCYAIHVVGQEKGRHVAQMEAGLRKGFGAPPKAPPKGGSAGSASGSAGSGAAANPSSAEVTLTLEKPLPGGLRARLRDDGESTRMAAAVCFYHARYPEQCRRHCERALASLEAP